MSRSSSGSTSAEKKDTSSDAVLVTPVAAAMARVSTCGRTVRSREVRSEVDAAAYSSARAGTYSAVVSRRPSGAVIRSAR